MSTAVDSSWMSTQVDSSWMSPKELTFQIDALQALM